MAKITLTDLTNLENQTTAVNAINSNSAAIETAFENTLSRDGTNPNKMEADLDMDSNRILNLPAPLSSGEPVRLQDLTDFQGDVIPTSVIPADPPDMFLVSNGTTYVPRNIVGSDLPNPTTSSFGGVYSKPYTPDSGIVLGGIANNGTPTQATNAVLTSASPFALGVGRLGATTPAFQVDSSQPNSVTGIKVTSQASGNGVNIESIGETNVPLIVNAKGSGTINFGTNSTGQIIMFQDVVTNGAHSINGQMAANTIKGNNTGAPALSTDLTPANVAAMATAPVLFASAAVNFNTTNTDYPINIVLPTGYTKYRIASVGVINSGTTASLTTATCGVWSSAAEAGLNIVATGAALSGLTTNTALTGNGYIQLSMTATAASAWFSSATNIIYFRMKTAQGAAASGTATIQIIPIP